MSLLAAEDWEATCLIFDDDNRRTTTMLDNQGGLLRGSIDLTFKLSDTVFCRRVAPYDHMKPRFKFWTVLHDSSYDEKKEGDENEAKLVFRVVFWCKPGDPAEEEEEDELYSRVDISLLSEYPHSFPAQSKTLWLDWMKKTAFQVLQDENLSYSVCVFVENRALDFFTKLYEFDDGATSQSLICFDDVGPAFYDVPTLMTASSVKRLLPLQRQYTNGSTATWHDTSKLSPKEKAMVVPLLLRWKEWLPIQCPICFDVVSPKDASICPCDHGFCTDCLRTYLRIKAEDLNSENSNNPFVCPLNTCRKGMKIVGFVKKFLSRDLMDDVRAWYKDIKTPPCYSLPGCLKKDCRGAVLRKEAVDMFMISCEVCSGRWCELCLQRAPLGKQHEDTPNCKLEVCQQFCERYLAASDKAKASCEARFPWIKLYANSRVHDQTIAIWIKENGQIC
ncbi:RWD (Partial), partial [Seminavis robusta]|eukprot:Sro3859_g351490.1 RWD (446) ;mRNA; r:2-1339